MSENSYPQPANSALTRLMLVLLPLAAMLGAFVWIASLDPLRSFNNGAPPVEALTVERSLLDETGIGLRVRAGGSDPMVIAQVAVDDAFWSFTQNPIGPITRGEAVWVQIPYPWVLGEAHVVKLLSNTGTAFEHEIAVAVSTPKATKSQLQAQALVGAIVGLLPVALGLMFYPAMRGVGRAGMNFLLALTVGLLAFLLIDMIAEALELASEAAALFQGSAMVWLAGLASFLLLMAIALHNVTEGIGIAAPMLRIRPPLWTFVALTLLAGGPAVLGMWAGSLAYAPQWSALVLAVGAGAIMQVMVEVGAYLMRQNPDRQAVLLSPAVLGGFLGGIAFMYATAALIKV